ncbi:MAG: calcium-binding protein, partial [Phycicoccus sp.]|nr:calcium-binding protein [Phycicoccus sp.]
VAQSGNGGVDDFTDGVVRPLGLVTTVDPSIGGDDVITTGVGADIVLGGAGGDRITTNRGETAGTPDGNGIVFGDHGFIDWVIQDADPSDIDRVWSTDTEFGGADTITTGNGHDVVVGGTDGDGITVFEGNNIVIGDNGQITAAATDGTQWGVPITLGRVETLDAHLGGVDTITSGTGNDIVLGGALGDTITAGHGLNLVFGDHGFIDWVIQDADPSDIDRIWSTDPGVGGVDVITTGSGDDLIIGGGYGDTIFASDGRNVVLGDNGRFTASIATPTPAWGTLPLTTGTLKTTDPTIGGADTITSGSGIDLILGGAAGDIVRAGGGADIVVGDHGFMDLAVRAGALQVVTITVTNNGIGGDDEIRGEAGEDILIGGTGNDRIDGGFERDLIFGDNVSLDRSETFGNHTNPRFRVLSGGQIYDTAGANNAGASLITAAWQNDPAGRTAWSDFLIALLDHDLATQDEATFGDGKPLPESKFGDDYIAGGAHDDMIFGQLGNDVIQGDGSIDLAVGASRDAAGYLVLNPSFEAATDGDEYIEGGGGSDVIFGNLGRDDIIGGSSGLFSTTSSSAAQAPRSAGTTTPPVTVATPTPSSVTTGTSIDS